MVKEQEKTELDPADQQSLMDLLSKKRMAVLLWKNKIAKEFAKNNNLDLLHFSSSIKSLENLPQYIIGVKENIPDRIAGNILLIEIPEIKEKLSKLYRKIKNMHPAEAIKLLLKYPLLKGNMEQPEVATMEGLLFGYKPCDINYYLRTRYYGAPKHANEDVAGEYKHIVLCEKCAKESVAERAN